MKYFLHDSSAFEDEKITQLFKKFGYEGLGLFYTALEKMAKQEKPVNTEVLKYQLKVGKKLEKCWKFMESIDILSSNNGETFNKQLLKFSEKYAIKKEKNSERIANWRKNQSLIENVTHYESVSNAPKDNISKVNESKVKEKEVEPLAVVPEPITQVEVKPVTKKEPAGIYPKMMNEYFIFFNKNFKGAPKIDAGQGKAMKDIIAYLGTLHRDLDGEARDGAVLAKWIWLLNNWDKLDNFNQNKTKLTDINGNIQNLIVQINNPKNGREITQRINGKNPILKPSGYEPGKNREFGEL